ncbi:MAG TPA: penicillin acylase family protein [Kofleriaceae bacterium]|nr:penicillin acylase family protein [Kofleriaceae bacterium]
MRPMLAPATARAILASLLSLSLSLVAACGDDDDDGTDANDGTDADDGNDGPDASVEQISIDGLSAPVDVYFDDQGILHASCQTDADCFAVEGYFHAAHRFAQMDIRRRLARGRLAALVGAPALATDKEQRQMMTSRDGQPLEEQLYDSADEPTRDALAAYSRGVNAWLADLAAGRNGAVLPDEYSFALVNQAAIQDDWEPLDSVACILPLVDQLTNHAGIDTLTGEIYGALPALVAEDLFPLRPPSTSTILPGPITARARAKATRAASRLHDRMAASAGLFRKALRTMPDASLDHSSQGSNNWIVGPERTSTGGALLANDPHLTLSHPAIWYLVDLDSRTNGEGDLHVTGASFAGLPGILLGHNEDIAWGATTTYFDATDVYVETLNKDGTAVIFDDGTGPAEVPITQVEYTFEVANGEPVTESFPFVPHHGPIISTDAKAGTALSVRWTGHDADTDINFILALAGATTVDTAREALRNVTTAGQNFVVADRAGNIGWFPYNRLPTRPWASAEVPSWMPVPGTGEFEWGPSIPYEELPQAVNPESGFLATANNDMTGALQDGNPYNDGDPFVQGVTDEGYRHQRISQRLAERDDHDLASMESIQSDVYSLLGELLTPAILAAVDGVKLDADAQAVVDALASWDFECASGLAGIEPDAPADPATALSGRGCLAFHVTYGRLRRLVFADELAELAPDISLTAQPAALIFQMTDPESLTRDYWNDVSTVGVETEADTVAAALSSAGAYLRKELGDDPEAWLWGRLHTLTLRADLFDGIGVGDYNSETFANDGGTFTVDVAQPRNEIDDNYVQTAGPSMRFACETGEAGVSCTIELPGGQRHDRSSPFYDSMLGDWLSNLPVPLVSDLAAAATSAAETLTVQPR